MMNSYKKQLFELLAIEYNCPPEAFSKNENIITLSALGEGRRMYNAEKHFFHMVTIGVTLNSDIFEVVQR